MAQDKKLTKKKRKKAALLTPNMQAFFNVGTENTKMLMALSTSAVGLLVLLMDKVDSILIALVWGVAQILFLANIFLLLTSMHLNGEYFVCREKGDKEGEKKVREKSEQLSLRSARCFGWGIRLTVIFASTIIFKNMMENGFAW